MWFWWSPLDAVAAVVERWQVGAYASERDAQDGLYAHLLRELPKRRVVREYGHDRAHADFLVEDRVAIEVKHGLSTTNEYRRLVGQIADYVDWEVVSLLVVLVRPTDPDQVRRVQQELDRRLNVFVPRGKLLVKA